MKFLWCIPSSGDSRYLGSAKGARAATVDYFEQIAVAADSLGYEGVPIPTGRSCEDSWIIAASLTQRPVTGPFGKIMANGLVPTAVTAQ